MKCEFFWNILLLWFTSREYLLEVFVMERMWYLKLYFGNPFTQISNWCYVNALLAKWIFIGGEDEKVNSFYYKEFLDCNYKLALLMAWGAIFFPFSLHTECTVTSQKRWSPQVLDATQEPTRRQIIRLRLLDHALVPFTTHCVGVS